MISDFVGLWRSQPLLKSGRVAVALRSLGLRRRDRPRDRDIRIGEGDIALALRVVEAGAFVLHFAVVGERAEAAREAVGRPDDFLAVGGNLSTEPFAERRRTLADVDRSEER